MRTHKTKEEYIAELKGKIARRNEILKAYEEVFKPLLDKFNGKVYNARFINELPSYFRMNLQKPYIYG